MPRYRNLVGTFLNYSDSGGPIVGPGEEFEHDIPAGQLASHLKAGFISEVPSDVVPPLVMDVVEQTDRTLLERLNRRSS